MSKHISVKEAQQKGIDVEHRLSENGEEWYFRGLLHRLEGPALIEPDGSKHWYQFGQRHRDQGPAVEKANGDIEFWHRGDLIEQVKHEGACDIDLNHVDLIEENSIKKNRKQTTYENFLKRFLNF